MPVISNGKLADFQAYYNAARSHASVGGPHALEPATPGLEDRFLSLRIAPFLAVCELMPFQRLVEAY